MMKTAMTTALTEEQLSRIPSDASLPSPALCMKLVLAGDLALERKQSPIELNEELKQNEALQRFFDGRSLCRTVAFEHPATLSQAHILTVFPAADGSFAAYGRKSTNIMAGFGRLITAFHGARFPGGCFAAAMGSLFPTYARPIRGLTDAPSLRSMSCWTALNCVICLNVGCKIPRIGLRIASYSCTI